ncbi:vomeronasal type-2 receptor 26-like [Pseudophryne corroboree]|uniref:vomeronasal type-2 receptor 26-like n=1 Tax=Pseudophryne corroboree TaxID=495146 RepID=UPI003081409A
MARNTGITDIKTNAQYKGIVGKALINGLNDELRIRVQTTNPDWKDISVAALREAIINHEQNISKHGEAKEPQVPVGQSFNVFNMLSLLVNTNSKPLDPIIMYLQKDFQRNAGTCLFNVLLEMIISLEEYRNILAFLFAVDEINNDPDLLPNVTLGYHIYNTCGDPKNTLQYVLQIMSGETMEAPNYSCMEHGEVAGFIGDSGFHTSHAMAQLLSLYQYPQINYGTTDPVLNERQLYPNFYRIVPDDRVRYTAIVRCLLHYGWNWVGVITPGDGSGDMELQVLSTMMAKHGICIEFLIKLTNDDNINRRKMTEIEKQTARVIIICGLFSMNFGKFFDASENLNENITLILHESGTDIIYMERAIIKPVNCSLIFILSPKKMSLINENINNIVPSTHPNDPLLEDIWLWIFRCLSSNTIKNDYYQFVYHFSAVNCSGKRLILPSYHGMKKTKPYYSYVAVYALAHAVQKMKQWKRRSDMSAIRQIRHYMKNLHYTDPTGEEMIFNERGDLPSKWSLANWVIYKNGLYYEFNVKHLTTFEDDQVYHLEPGKITWKKGTIPKSRCNDKCSPGYRKASKGGFHVCCYDCVPCSEGEMSNVTDSETCHRCSNEEWSDERRVRCVPKKYDFLTYEQDIVGKISTVTALSFSAITLFILGIFIYYWNTPIVKANNRAMSFILLVSILLSFLCVFLFLGQPVDITCRLRQMSFGILFSTAVSSVLAKTITVCIAFKATKPSPWRKWVTLKVSNYVVIVCSSVQVLICSVWLSVSPPYQEHDHHSYKGMIIIQCNEGSVIGLYSMLGYMGILATVSFVLAFMVRTLPDSYNEAKYITFSMLVFCSVWIAMIPAYLSTKGKYAVAVEIFAILASCAGVLGCIFFPKLVILLFRTDLNSRKMMLGKTKP